MLSHAACGKASVICKKAQLVIYNCIGLSRICPIRHFKANPRSVSIPTKAISDQLGTKDMGTKNNEILVEG